jgi:AhpD family alkylhydroperoxidase
MPALTFDGTAAASNESAQHGQGRHPARGRTRSALHPLHSGIRLLGRRFAALHLRTRQTRPQRCELDGQQIPVGDAGRPDRGNCQAQPRHDQGLSGADRRGQKTNVLRPKTRELFSLAVAVTVQCDDRIAVHTEAAARHGASREEIAEAPASRRPSMPVPPSSIPLAYRTPMTRSPLRDHPSVLLFIPAGMKKASGAN